MSDRPRTASSGHSGYASVRTPSRAGTASSAGRSYTGSELAALVQQRNAIKAQLHRVDAALAREAAFARTTPAPRAPPSSLPRASGDTSLAVRSDRAWVGGRQRLAAAPAPPRDDNAALPGALQPGCHAFFPSRLPGAAYKRPTLPPRRARDPPPPQPTAALGGRRPPIVGARGTGLKLA